MTGSNAVRPPRPNCRVCPAVESLWRLQQLPVSAIERERDHVRRSLTLARPRPRALQPSSSTAPASQLGALLRFVLLREDARQFPDACLDACMPARASDESQPKV